MLLCALAFFSIVAIHQSVHTRSWTSPLEVVVLPINADQHIDTDRYIKSLSNGNLREIESWFKREAERYTLTLEAPVEISLGPQVFAKPPEFPGNSNFVNVLAWGLRFRWWA